MGGNAFGLLEPPIRPQRLPSTTYQILRDQYIESLHQVFLNVGSPIESPGKTSHGDIDIIVSGPKSTEEDHHLSAISQGSATTTKDTAVIPDSNADNTLRADIGPHIPRIEKILQPSAHVYSRGAPSVSFAMLIPKPLIVRESPGGKHELVREVDLQYCQVDITLVPSTPPSLFPWAMFLNSYGDLWSILGISLRQCGLLANPSGFFLISPELEQMGKKRGRLLLTRDPDEILEYLGLPKLQTIRGGYINNQALLETQEDRHIMSKVEEVFEVLTSNRFFNLDVYQRFTADPLRANDKQRMTRPMFRRFITSCVPKLIAQREESRGIKRRREDTPPSLFANVRDEKENIAPEKQSVGTPKTGTEEAECEQTSGTDRRQTRDEIKAEALEKFGKHAEWDAMHETPARPKSPKSPLNFFSKLPYHWAKGVRREEADIWKGYTGAWIGWLGMVVEKGEEKGTSKYKFP